MARREFDVVTDVRRAVPAVRVDETSARRVVEQIAEEAPIALIYNGAPHVVVMATPANLEDLALGFSLTEGVIGTAAELGGVEIVPEKTGYSIYLSVPPERVAVIERRRRNMTARTGCGVCGAETIEQAMRDVPNVTAPKVAGFRRVTRQAMASAMKQMPVLQTLNAATGATHAAAWASLDGQLQLVREDVGRHNALDKLIGALAAGGMDTAQGFAVITSRASYEMVQKAAMAGIGLLAAVSAPTALAVRIAREAGVTLAGFVRGERCMVYADEAHRLTQSADWKE
ncbi:MAG TPA: formate dehydrogenase accessory sulfurtransferase FdhD [Burkholderiales bacterium]|nr:formate dehydrogenase accessory sulfurtransferase FdhD [Burkholderiales bacterium]